MKKPIPNRGGLFYLASLIGDRLEFVKTRLPTPMDQALHCQSGPIPNHPTRRVSVQANLGSHQVKREVAGRN